ncbi:MAG: hypothetical protein ABI947_16570 [Chloroflexota bacterium]
MGLHGIPHMTLALLAHTWLTVLRHQDAQKKFPPTALSGGY